jgi:hypothetical protein
MPTYLDVGVVRIQKYLTRTPDLKSRRGASSLVAVATSVDAVTSAVASVRANTQPGDADGVVHLMVIDGHAVEDAATEVMAHISRLMPAAELEASWATAPSYADGYPELARRREANPVRYFPSLMDIPLVQRCDGCAQAGAGSQQVEGKWFCGDCTARARAAGSRHPQKVGSGGLDAEQRLLKHLNGDTQSLRSPETFEDLALLGSDEKRNHLATIFIDGNGIGKWFEFVGKKAPSQYSTLSRMVTSATNSALQRAATLSQQDQSKLSTIPHVVGGDDVLVTVPASQAWLFTTTFLGVFADEINNNVVGLMLDAHQLRPPSASAGVLIAKTAFPFSDAVSIAGNLLKQAKASNKGTAPAVSWLDVTRHGPVVPVWRRPRTLEWVTDFADDLTYLAQLEHSSIATFRALSEVELPGRDEASVISRQASRLKITGTPLLQPSNGEEVATLADALDIARWRGVPQ